MKTIIITFLLIILIFNCYLFSEQNENKFILNLKILLQTIEKNNVEVINKRENIKYKSYQIEETKSQSRPAVTLQSNYSKLAVSQSGSSSYDNYNYKIELLQPLFTYGKISTAIKISDYYSKNAELEYELTLRKKQLNGIFLLYTIKLLESKRQILLATEKSLFEHLKNVKTRVEVGSVTNLDYLTAEVNYKQVCPQIIGLENAIENAKNDLKLLLNLDLTTGIIINEDFEIEDFSKFTKDRYLKSAVEEDESLNRLRKQLKILELQKVIAKNSLRPDLNLITNFGGSANKFNNIIEEEEYYFGVNLNFPLFDGWKSKNQVNQFEIEINSTKRDIDILKKKLKIEIEKEMNNLKQYKTQIEVNKFLVGQSDEAYRVAKQNYINGAAINTEVIEAEKNKLNSKILLVESKYNYIISLMNLKYLLSQKFL